MERDELVDAWTVWENRCVIGAASPVGNWMFWRLVCHTVIFFLRKAQEI